jgi:predicted nucleic acid-binding protein
MTQRYGIDTSVLVRLVTREPEADFQDCVNKLRVLVDDQRCEVFASNQVVGEAYIAIRHHYGKSSAEARATRADVLHSGLVAPLNGSAVIRALQSEGGPGVFDSLIAEDYSRAGLQTLTRDRAMASLAGVQRL